MTETKKQTVGQVFLEVLKAASKSKEQLLTLASMTIRKSHVKRTLIERKLPDDITAIKMLAAPAEFNARLGRDVSSDGMLLMIMSAYSKHPKGSPENFKRDFKKAFPKEYGQEKTSPQKTNINNLFAKTKVVTH